MYSGCPARYCEGVESILFFGESNQKGLHIEQLLMIQLRKEEI